MKKCMPSPDQLTSRLVGWRYLSKFAEPEVDGTLQMVSLSIGFLDLAALCQYKKIDTGVLLSNMSSYLHRNSPKQTF